MFLFSALRKLLLRKKINSYYNSDFLLSTKEKQSVFILGFVILFPLILASIFIIAY